MLFLNGPLFDYRLYTVGMELQNSTSFPFLSGNFISCLFPSFLAYTRHAAVSVIKILQKSVNLFQIGAENLVSSMTVFSLDIFWLLSICTKFSKPSLAGKSLHNIWSGRKRKMEVMEAYHELKEPLLVLYLRTRPVRIRGVRQDLYTLYHEYCIMLRICTQVCTIV